MGMDVKSGGGVRSDINVTPLVDVVLVLLIIFMVVTPMLQRGKDVQLPVTSNPEAKKTDEKNEVLISITLDKRIFIDTTQVSHEQFLASMSEAFQRNPGKTVVIKGDRRLTFGDVKEVMLLINQSGFTNVAVMADKAEGGAAGQ